MDLRNLPFNSARVYSSAYRGVTKHRFTGRYEVHLWEKMNDNRSRKGKQGGYEQEEKAARAYDLAALKYWGQEAVTNFPIITYEKELKEMQNRSKQEYINFIRRDSTSFSRGRSVYRGVTRHRNEKKWQARIGRVAGHKDLYLGKFETEEEAAKAYDIAVIKYKGPSALTNFEISRYDLEAIMSTELPVERTEHLASTGVQEMESIERIENFLKDAADAQAENNVNKSIITTGSTESSLTGTVRHSNASATPSNAALEQPVQASPIMACYQKQNPAAQQFMPTNKNYDFLYNLTGFEPGAIDEHGISKTISKTMASAQGLVMGDSSFPSHSSLAAQFIDTQEEFVASNTLASEYMLPVGTFTRSIVCSPGKPSGFVRAGYENLQEGLVNSRTPSSGNMLSVGTFPRSIFCSPAQASGIVRAAYVNVIIPQSNWMASSLQYPENGPIEKPACQASQSEPIAETACQAPMFNIWSDIQL
ncbi:hypothetical protein SUGI_0871750 [Cryptomeria japonica]|nr:hypothetical protein SUGI_0871750 [Cryptomeria japonica]